MAPVSEVAEQKEVDAAEDQEGEGRTVLEELFLQALISGSPTASSLAILGSFGLRRLVAHSCCLLLQVHQLVTLKRRWARRAFSDVVPTCAAARIWLRPKTLCTVANWSNTRRCTVNTAGLLYSSCAGNFTTCLGYSLLREEQGQPRRHRFRFRQLLVACSRAFWGTPCS